MNQLLGSSGSARRFGLFSIALVACGTTPSTEHVGGTQDAGTPPFAVDSALPPFRADSGLPTFHIDAGAAPPSPDGGQPVEAGPIEDTGSVTGTTTIAMARKSNATGTITVKAFVTALAGVPADYPQWYVEDPEGGEYSGVVVYCDPLVTTPCNVPEPALHDLILVTGRLVTYMGQVELEPTAMSVVQSNAVPPPVPSLTAADIAPKGDSPYRGVYVSLAITAPTKLVVDGVTPAALADSACGATFDAGVATCTNVCEPPVYSGFQANDGTGNEVYIEAPFFHTDPLQSSPECLTQGGVVAVKVGMTFSAMAGILDIDPYSGSQDLSPVQPSDYATP
jgi:hypothetical protein